MTTMATPAGREAARDALRRAMYEMKLGVTELAEASGVDPATAGDFLAGRRWPRAATLSKLEKAVGLTPGTLAALGEEAMAPSVPLDQASTRRLVALLTQRFVEMEELLSQWATPAARYERRSDETFTFALRHESEDGPVGDAARIVTGADLIENTRALTAEEEARLDRAVLLLDAYRWHEGVAKTAATDQGSLADDLARLRDQREDEREPAPVTPINHKRERLLRDALPVDEAAYDGDEPGEWKDGDGDDDDTR